MRSATCRSRLVRSGAQLLAGIALLLMSVLSGHHTIAFVLLVLATAGVYAYSPGFWGISQQIFNGPQAAVLVAGVASIGQIGGLVAPYLFGMFTSMTGSTNAGIVYLGVGVLVAATIMVVFRSRWVRPSS